MLVAERFEIEALVGKGSMGEVYRARDRVTGDRVAVKILLAEDTDSGERFAREAKLLLTLRHPRIVRYVAHGTAEGRRYLAMEWMDGEDLATRLRRAGLTPAESLAMVARIAEGLAVIHAHGVVHRDIKPSNLFLPDGDIERVKILDFGVARLAGGTKLLTRAGATIGTPAYMAPEQARGDHEVGATTDIFALGCVLFECLTGRPPFVAQTAVAVLAKILFEDPPRLGDLRPELGGLDDLVARMLAKDPHGRPGSATELLAELRGTTPPNTDAVSVEGLARHTITTQERRLVCIVVAAPPGMLHDEGPEKRWDADPSLTLSPSLMQLASRHQARVETLRNRSVVAVLSTAGSATDLAARAARCALTMRATLPEATMAIATGRAVVTADRFPVGDIIDAAAALLAEGDSGIRIDETTAGLLDPRFEVAGRKLVGEREDAEPARRLLGRPTPCVGRDREIAVLDALLDECLDEDEPQARAALLVGPPGIGKSRLAHEFLRRQRERHPDLQVWMAQGDPVGAGSPFGILSRALRRGLGLLDPAGRRERLRARAERAVPAEAGRIAEFLGELLGVPATDEPSVQLRTARGDLMMMGDQIRRAFEDFLRGEAAGRPVVLVLEDLHWGDLPTVKLVDAALRACAGSRLFVLATARPEVDDLFPGLWRDRGAQPMRLHPLPRKAAERLVRAILPADLAPERVARLVEQSEGNAFFLEELIRQAALGRDELPPTVLAMVQARIEALPDQARRVLRACAVFGQAITPAGVAALVGGAAAVTDAEDWLRALTDAEILTDRGDDLAFRHALVREAAYAMLTDADRELGHRLAADWLAEQGARDALILAEHCERGGDPARAAGYYLRAAEQALEGNDLKAALARAGRGAALGASGETRGRLLLVEAEAHRWRGAWAAAETCAHEAVDLLPRGSGAWSEAVGEAALASRVLDHVGRLLELVDAVRGAPAGADSDAASRVTSMARLAALLYYSGRYALADALLEEIAPLQPRVAEDPGIEALQTYTRGIRAAFTGDLDAALAEAEAARALYDAAGNARRACNMSMLAALARVHLGDYAGAVAGLAAPIAAAEGMGLHNVEALGRQVLGIALARLGRVDDGLREARTSAAMFAGQGDRRLEGTSHRYLAQIHLLRGETAAAAVQAEAAVELLGALPPSLVAGLAVLAEVRLLQGRPAEAQALAERGWEILAVLGSVPDGESLLDAVYVEALAQTGGDAEEERAAARERLGARAARIADPAARRRFVDGVPDNARVLGPR